jgi:hypothetical protein
MSSESYIVPEFIADEIYDKGWQDGYDSAILDELEDASTLALQYYTYNKQALDKLLKWRDVMNELKVGHHAFQYIWRCKYIPTLPTFQNFDRVVEELHQRFELDAKIKEIGDRLLKTLTPNVEATIYGRLFH